jgi:hypothetical protein
MTEKKPIGLYKKLLNVMKNAKKLIKENSSGMPYASVTHNMTTQTVKEQFLKEGLIFIPYVKSHSRDGNIHHVTVAAEIIDTDTGDKLPIGDFPGSGVDNQDKGYGKALSYAFKYLLQKLFLLEIGKDEEVDAHQQEAQSEQEQKNAKVRKYVADVTKTLDNIRKHDGEMKDKIAMLDKVIQQEDENMTKLEQVDEKQYAILQKQIDKLSAELMS